MSAPARRRLHTAISNASIWGDVAPGTWSLDIWIGSRGDRGRGLGTIAMHAALCRIFDHPGCRRGRDRSSGRQSSSDRLLRTPRVRASRASRLRWRSVPGHAPPIQHDRLTGVPYVFHDATIAVVASGRLGVALEEVTPPAARGRRTLLAK